MNGPSLVAIVSNVVWMMSEHSCFSLAPAFRHGQFRRYFAGQAISVIGSWIQTVAISWVIYRLTNSSLLLGVAAFLIQGPQLLLTPLVGAWIERADRKRILLLVQVANLVIAALLSALTFAGVLSSFHLLCASAALGVLNSVDTPLRQSLLVHLIGDKRDLSSAIALNASIFTTGRFVGPLIAGFMLKSLPEAVCFLTNALSFLALIAALLSIRIDLPDEQRELPASLRKALIEGLAHARGSDDVRIPLFVLAAVNFTASSALVLAPVFVGQVLSGDPESLGWLLGAAGAGAMSATVLLTGRHSLSRITYFLSVAPLISATGLGLLAMNTRLPAALFAMFLIGTGIALTNVSTNSILQNLVPEILRGRVVSLFSAVRFGMDAAGGLMAGFSSSLIGPIHTLLLSTLALLAAMLLLFPRVTVLKGEMSSQ